MVFYYAKKVKYLTSREYELELKKIKAQNRQIEMKRNLKAAKVKRFNIPRVSTSKLILVAVLLLNLQIIHFVEKAIMTYGDLSALSLSLLFQQHSSLQFGLIMQRLVQKTAQEALLMILQWNNLDSHLQKMMRLSVRRKL